MASNNSSSRPPNSLAAPPPIIRAGSSPVTKLREKRPSRLHVPSSVQHRRSTLGGASRSTRDATHHFPINLSRMLCMISSTVVGDAEDPELDESVDRLNMFVLFLRELHAAAHTQFYMDVTEFKENVDFLPGDAVQKKAQDIVSKWLAPSLASNRSSVSMDRNSVTFPAELVKSITKDLDEKKDISGDVFNPALRISLRIMRVDILPRLLAKYNVELNEPNRPQGRGSIDSTGSAGSGRRSLSDDMGPLTINDPADVRHVLDFCIAMLKQPYVDCYEAVEEIVRLPFGSPDQLAIARKAYKDYFRLEAENRICFPPSLAENIHLSLDDNRVRVASFVHAQQLLVSIMQADVVAQFLVSQHLKADGLDEDITELVSILDDSVKGPLFLSFSYSLHTADPVLLYFDVDKWRLTSPFTPARHSLALKIYQTYVGPHARRAIGCPDNRAFKIADLIQRYSELLKLKNNEKTSEHTLEQIRVDRDLGELLEWLQRMALAIARVEAFPSFKTHHFYKFSGTDDSTPVDEKSALGLSKDDTPAATPSFVVDPSYDTDVIHSAPELYIGPLGAPVTLPQEPMSADNIYYMDAARGSMYSRYSLAGRSNRFSTASRGYGYSLYSMRSARTSMASTAPGLSPASRDDLAEAKAFVRSTRSSNADRTSLSLARSSANRSPSSSTRPVAAAAPTPMVYVTDPSMTALPQGKTDQKTEQFDVSGGRQRSSTMPVLAGPMPSMTSKRLQRAHKASLTPRSSASKTPTVTNGTSTAPASRTPTHAERLALFKSLEPLFIPSRPTSKTVAVSALHRRAKTDAFEASRSAGGSDDSVVDEMLLMKRRELIAKLAASFPELASGIRRRTIVEEHAPLEDIDESKADHTTPDDEDAEDQTIDTAVVDEEDALAAHLSALEVNKDNPTDEQTASVSSSAAASSPEKKKKKKKEKEKKKKKKKKKGVSFGPPEHSDEEMEPEKRRPRVRFSVDGYDYDAVIKPPRAPILKVRKPIKVHVETFEEVVVRVFSERQRETDRLLAILTQGAVLKKYNSMQSSDKRWFEVSADGTEISWEKALAQSSRNKPNKNLFKRGSSWLSSLVKNRKSRELAEVTDMKYSTYWSDRFQRYNMRGKAPWLGFSLFFPDRTLDIVCANETEVTVWFLGIQSLIPLNSSYMSKGALLWERAQLKVEMQADQRGVSERKIWAELLYEAKKKMRMEQRRHQRVATRSWGLRKLPSFNTEAANIAADDEKDNPQQTTGTSSAGAPPSV